MLWMKKFWKDESAEEIPIEFTLLMAFVVLASGPIILKSAGSAAAIWNLPDAIGTSNPPAPGA
jgi:hypothetical protein